ncbi:hypothetical protein DFS33DRAFT_1269259 [Desarmillaria ectypa]|nr:hypothetical protein DFS33DRAFT_1269259 [Desarmillaria ectypa]
MVLRTCLGLYFATLSIGHAFRRKVLREQTCLLDADDLDVRLAAGKIEGTAVICGGSVGYLTTARVCHDQFEQVVIVDPEAWLNYLHPQRAESKNQENKRSRVMQYNSLHGKIRWSDGLVPSHFKGDTYPAVLLAMGYIVLSKPFPNLDKECKSPVAEYGGLLPKTTYAVRAGLETPIRIFVKSRARSPASLEMEEALNSSNQLYGPSSCRLGREGYGFADRYTKNQLPLDKLKITYDQKLHCSTLQFRVPPELRRRLPGLPVPYDECGMIYCLFTDSAKDYRIMYSQRVDGDFRKRAVFSQNPFKLTLSRYKAVNPPSNWVALGDSVMRVNPIYGYATKSGDYAYPTTAPVAGEASVKGSWLRWSMQSFDASNRMPKPVQLFGTPEYFSPLRLIFSNSASSSKFFGVRSKARRHETAATIQISLPFI